MGEQKLGPNQKKWVKALRSGKYRQTKEALHSGGCHCCLGVAVRVFEPNATIPTGWETLEGFDATFNALLMYGHDGPLMHERLNGTFHLTQANDEGATFEEIADFIEAHPSAVFTEAK